MLHSAPLGVVRYEYVTYAALEPSAMLRSALAAQEHIWARAPRRARRAHGTFWLAPLIGAVLINRHCQFTTRTYSRRQASISAVRNETMRDEFEYYLCCALGIGFIAASLSLSLSLSLTHSHIHTHSLCAYV